MMRLVTRMFVVLLALSAGRVAAAPAADFVGINGAACAHIAIADAVASAVSGDTIYVSPGMYNEILGTINKDLHFVAATTDCTAADPDASPSDYVINGGGAAVFHGGIANIAANRTVTFTRMLLTNAEAIRGGLIYVEPGASLTFEQANLSVGHADDVGGILYVAPGASLFMNGPSFVYSADAGNAGGALYIEGHAELDAVRIRDNTALSGGGVALAADAHLILTNTDIGSQTFPNIAEDGGGLHMTSASQLEMYGLSAIMWNQATTGHGGGIYAQGAVTVEMYEISRIYGNEALENGGGIYAANGAAITLHDNSQIGLPDPTYANSATQGGGIYADAAQGVSLFDEAQILHNMATTNGGGIYVDGNTPLNMLGATVQGNQAAQFGGGIALVNGQATLRNVLISENQANVGGGMGQGNHANNEVTITDSQIVSNTVTGLGGGIASAQSPVALVDTDGSSQLSYNHAGVHGGGAYLAGPSGLFLVAVEPGSQMHVEQNTAGGSGGGLYVDNGFVGFQNVRVYGNQAGNDGGGLFLSDAEAVVIHEAALCNNALLPADDYCSEWRDNTAVGSGGAFYTELGAGLTVQHTALIGNDAALGGAVAATGNGDTLEITNSLIEDNTGKAIFINGDAFLDLAQSTLAGNDWAVDIDVPGASASFQNNIIWDNGFGVESEVPLGGGCSFSQNGVGGDAIDPLFQSTARGEYRLQHDSPAVDACAIGVDFDLDGAPRPQGADYDSGAFEAPPTMSVAPADVVEGNAGDTTPMTFTVSLSGSAAVTTTVDYLTFSVTASAANDFQAQNGTLTLLPGQQSADIIVPVNGDDIEELDEQLRLELSNAVGATLLPGGSEALGTIINDDIDDDGGGDVMIFLPLALR